jgi:hypothetical protein
VLLLLLLLLQALKTMGHDEGDRNFGVEVPMEQQAQVWHNRCAGLGEGGTARYSPALLPVLVGLCCGMLLDSSWVHARYTPCLPQSAGHMLGCRVRLALVLAC